MWICDVGVDLGGGDVAMAKQGLDRPQVGAVHQQISSEAVSKRMRADMFGDASQQSIAGYHALDAAGSQAVIVAG